MGGPGGDATDQGGVNKPAFTLGGAAGAHRVGASLPRGGVQDAGVVEDRSGQVHLHSSIQGDLSSPNCIRSSVAFAFQSFCRINLSSIDARLLYDFVQGHGI